MNGGGQLKAQTQELLGGLGRSRNDVADALRRLGIWALPKDPRRCAVAHYLGAVLAADPRVRSLAVRSGRVEVRVRGMARYRWPKYLGVPIPLAVRQFISAYDEGVYPDLIRVVAAASITAPAPRHGEVADNGEVQEASVVAISATQHDRARVRPPHPPVTTCG